MAGFAAASKSQEEGIADRWFETQRALFVEVGKSIGDQVRAHVRTALIKRVCARESNLIITLSLWSARSGLEREASAQVIQCTCFVLRL